MNNRIETIDKVKASKLKKLYLSADNTYCVEIEGYECTVLLDYLSEVSKKFAFPTEAKILDVYDDWLTDLGWLDEDNIVVFINDYEKFLEDDLPSKEKVMNLFKYSVLPWWEIDVCNCVVDGKAKSFIVYIVN